MNQGKQTQHTTNPLGVRQLHHVEFQVGNAKQAAYFFRKAFGFSVLAYRGLETGDREVTRYVLGQGRIRLVLATPLTPENELQQQLRDHGDGARDVAMEVADARAAFEIAVGRGATAVQPPREIADEHGKMVHASIRAYGDTVHSFYSQVDYRGPFLPGYASREQHEPDAGLLAIDHIVANVAPGKMNELAGFYNGVFGFERYMTFDDKDISTEYSALRSVVMSDEHQVVKMPINEPAEGRRKSQIQEYLDYNGSPGVQHLALLTRDIVATVGQLVKNGVEFLAVPSGYYDRLVERVGQIDEPLSDLSPLGILVDRDDRGYLLQLFTKPLTDRPTFFVEIIQRKGARGFGKGNFKALFESIEQEQQKRGNL